MSSLPPDPWKVLGIEKSADKTELRKAYRRLVLSCHPDKVQDPALKALKQDEFQKVQQAYELLNDDTERAKYEEQVKLHELRKAQVAAHSKNMPNISASRTPPRSYNINTHFNVEIVEPRHRPSPSYPASHTKMYASSARTKSYEHVDYRSSEEEYRRSRRDRETSYEKPSRREEEAKESRRRDEKRDSRREEEERAAIERERLDKETRKARKATEKDRSKEKKKGMETKTHRNVPYVEPYVPEDDVYAAAQVKVEKKKVSSSSSIKKHDEPREKSSSRRAKDGSARVEDVRKEKIDLFVNAAASYIEQKRSKPGIARAQTMNEHYRAPSPPPNPVEYDEEDVVRRSSARAARRRPSDSHDLPRHELPRRSNEKLVHQAPVYQTSHKSREAVDVPPSPPKERGAPPAPLAKRSYTSPVVEAEPSPRHRETSSRRPPQIVKSQTWAASGDARAPPIFEDYVSDADRHEEPSRRHRSTRRESPEEPRRQPIRRETSYKVSADRRTTAKVEAVYDDGYAYDDRRGSSRRHASYDVYEEPQFVESTRGADYYYEAQLPFKVKTSKPVTADDVSYTSYRYPSQPIYSQS